MAAKFPWIYILGGFAFGSGFFLPFGISFASEQIEIEQAVNGESKESLKEENSDLRTLELKLLADRQYDLNEKIFVAEGNIKVSLKGAILKADRIEFDRLKKTLFATGNVTLIKDNQYFQATSLFYDFINESGVLKNVYGVIDIESISNDLSLLSSDEELIESKEEISQMPIKNIKLKGGYRIVAGSITSQSKIISRDNINDSTINRWRIQSLKIKINPNGWSSDEIIFTNDPLNPAQTSINAKDVVATKDENDSTLISIGKSRLIIEDRVSIPYKRNSKFSFGDGEKLGWALGLDFKDRDGLFISKQLQPIDLNDNLELSLQPQFLFQRAIRGETNSYISPGSSFLSDKVLSTTNTFDLFGLNADLKGQKYNWDLELSANISTFNSKRFSDGARYTGRLSKDFSFKEDQEISASIFTAYRYKAWNGSLGESEIHYALGTYLEKKGEINLKKSKHEYDLRLGTANYEAESSYNKKLINLSKTNIFSSLKSIYPIWTANKKSDFKKLSYRYSPVPISSRLSFNTELNSSYSIYGDHNSQALFSLAAGPALTIGNFEKPFFDFTRVSIMPGITIKDGASPFKFDNEVDLRTLKIEFDQQIVGPLLLSSNFEYNIDSRSYNYKKSLSSQTALIIHRRSYEFGIFYQPHEQTGGIMFRLNGFSFNQSGSPFVKDKNLNIISEK